MEIKFDENGYKQALIQAVERALEKIDMMVYNSLVSRLMAISPNELDTKYFGEMQASIRKVRLDTATQFVRQFIAGGMSKPNQAFRVIYYQYGTGSLMKPPPWYNPTDDPYWNPDRPKEKGTPIYYRKKGSWIDAGGNKRYSSYNGVPKEIPETDIRGKPIEPSFWFTKGFRSPFPSALEIILDAVKSVPITSYIKFRGLEKRM